MFLIKRPSGRYFVAYFENGKRLTKTTGTKSKAEALKFLREFKGKPKPKLQTVTLSDFSDQYLDYSAKLHALNTTRTAKSALAEFMAFIGDKQLDHITVRDVEAFYTFKRESAKPHTIRKYHATLSSAFHTAQRWNHVENNPLKDTAKPRTPELLPVYFTKEDFGKLIQAVQPDLKEVVYFALFSGARLGEIVNLKWKDVDLDRRVILIENDREFRTKSGKSRVVPINDDLYTMLKVMHESRGEFVFEKGGRPYLPGYVSHQFKKAVRRAGLSDELKFHSLRHSFASWLAKEGASLFEIQKLLGHKDSRTTLVYAHLQAGAMHETVNKIKVG